VTATAAASISVIRSSMSVGKDARSRENGSPGTVALPTA
jgi:hypothetical protein